VSTFRSTDRGPTLAAVVDAIPHPNPREIVGFIRNHGYVGQDVAVRTTALMAYRHVARLKKLHVQGMAPEALPPKTNLLFAGPTGCGKTYLVEILFRDILELPTVIVDMTSYSETGYVGQDVSTILTRLLYAADLNPVAATVGVVCLDEFDKLASGQNNAVFAGAGTTKDVSGLGVQRELLKMLETAEVNVSVEISHSEYAPRSVISTRDIPFIACGAFSGLKGLIEKHGEHIGFGRAALSGNQERIAVSLTDNDVELARNFLDYGFLPELIGRFKRYVPFGALDQKDLVQILRANLLPRYRTEFASEGKKLKIDAAAISRVIQDSIAKETGARGLEASLMRVLEDAAFEAYSTPESTLVEIVFTDGHITHRLG
jgi:ATP-dependent Clp protease ATP-binding subunit ClpX